MAPTKSTGASLATLFCGRTLRALREPRGVMPRLARIGTVIVLLLCAFNLYGASVNGHQATKSTVRYDRGERLLSVVRIAPLKEVLKDVGRQTGVQFTVHKSVESDVTMTFTGLSLERGLRRLLGRYDYMFVYRRTDEGMGTKLQAVEVLSRPEKEEARRKRAWRRSTRRRWRRR